MAEDQESNEIDYEIERLEDTQITGRELNRGFDRVYQEIDHLEDKVDLIQSEFKKFRNEINQKLDTILKHITGMN